MKRVLLLLCIATAIVCPALAATGDETESEKGTVLESDRNGDGRVDYRIRLDENGTKLYEEVDYNFDGNMDDFYYYSRGVLVRREVDSNYDGNIDIWAYLHEGVYVKRYERDTNHDGNIDFIQDFDDGK